MQTELKNRLEMWVGVESHKRSIAKAITWRFMGTLVTISVAYLLTRELLLSAGIGSIDAMMKIVAYYAHERLWNKIGYGRKKEIREDYMI